MHVLSSLPLVSPPAVSIQWLLPSLNLPVPVTDSVAFVHMLVYPVHDPSLPLPLVSRSPLFNSLHFPALGLFIWLTRERRRLELWDVLSILLKFGEPTGYYQTPWSVPSASPELVPPSCAVLHMPLSHKKDFSEWLARLCLGKWSSHSSCYFGLTLHPHPASSTHTQEF